MNHFGKDTILEKKWDIGFYRSDLTGEKRVEMFIVELAENSLPKRLAFSVGEVAILPLESNGGGKEHWQELWEISFAGHQGEFSELDADNAPRFRLRSYVWPANGSYSSFSWGYIRRVANLRRALLSHSDNFVSLVDYFRAVAIKLYFKFCSRRVSVRYASPY